MTAQVWETWCSGMIQKIEKHCHISHGCELWDGATTRSGPNAQLYGVVKARLPFTGKRRKLRVHVLMYLASHVEDRSVILGDRDFDISHRCCQSLCVSLSHLSREPRRL